MEILNVSAECFPIAKVGGLADVVGALPKYQQKKGVTNLRSRSYKRFTKLYFSVSVRIA